MEQCNPYIPTIPPTFFFSLEFDLTVYGFPFSLEGVTF
ncbi:hypothetical protein Nizo2831_1891 [Lactiplantibacillus plantarum]|nr:hypothetical protein LbDm2_2237 [Levilactobacillus brevis]KZU42316.1 hypothetical protein Nizo2753_1039 [Lactiplantibacillus plantarum]KZU45591.1 hypothetical protein Nizo2757_1359 [Lactiplantibacillus plantarum]KZU47523.1 hypothetical protein Nizo2766_0844 [Lactiplantibacillus plantarum]KZU65225.1 hypothetical protein Nizo2831_1891 [Lactiplantibacillus plantarum]